jgi:hypothetical protein
MRGQRAGVVVIKALPSKEAPAFTRSFAVEVFGGGESFNLAYLVPAAEEYCSEDYYNENDGCTSATSDDGSAIVGGTRDEGGGGCGGCLHEELGIRVQGTRWQDVQVSIDRYLSYLSHVWLLWMQ